MHSWTGPSASLSHAKPASVTRKIRSISKLWLYSAFTWQVTVLSALYGLSCLFFNSALREVHRDSNWPKVTLWSKWQQDQNSSSLAPESWPVTTKPHCLWAEQLIFRSAMGKDICQRSWRTKEIESWGDKSGEMGPQSTNGENSSFGGWGSWVWLQAPRLHTNHVTWSRDRHPISYLTPLRLSFLVY